MLYLTFQIAGEQLQAQKIAQLEHQYNVLENRQKALIGERNMYREKARAYDIYLQEREVEQRERQDEATSGQDQTQSNRRLGSEDELEYVRQDRDRLRVELMASKETAETHLIDLWQLEQINTVIVGAHNRFVEEKKELLKEIHRFEREKRKYYRLCGEKGFTRCARILTNEYTVFS